MSELLKCVRELIALIDKFPVPEHIEERLLNLLFWCYEDEEDQNLNMDSVDCFLLWMQESECEWDCSLCAGYEGLIVASWDREDKDVTMKFYDNGTAILVWRNENESGRIPQVPIHEMQARVLKDDLFGQIEKIREKNEP